jgi:hypothetical protein
LALFFAVGGVGYAKKIVHLVDGSTIKKGTIQADRLSSTAQRALKGNQGPVGNQGAQGIQGNQGAQGLQGLTGDTGPSAGYGVFKDTATICGISGCNTSVTLANLPAGAYAIFAKIRADATGSTGRYARTAMCTLSAESDTDHASAELTQDTTTTVSARVATLPLQLVHTFAAAGSVGLICVPDNVFFYDAKITAIRLGQVSNTAAP